MATTRARSAPPPITYNEASWRETHGNRTYVLPGTAFEDYLPAYRYGVLVAGEHGRKEFAEVEPLLAGGWPAVRGDCRLDWEQVRPAVADAYAGAVHVQPVESIPHPAKKVPARRSQASGSTGKTRKSATTERDAGSRTKREAAVKTSKHSTTTTRSRSGGDNLRNRGPQDRTRVNVNERWEMNYWCQRLGVTPARLRSAVKKAGPMVKDVRRELRK